MSDIKVTRLSKSFDGKTVLDNLSLTLPAGSTTCLMAPSGYGKTTLLNILLGLLPPDSGELEGCDVRMCPVFQEDRLSPVHTARENIRPALSRHTPPAKTKKRPLFEVAFSVAVISFSSAFQGSSAEARMR